MENKPEELNKMKKVFESKLLAIFLYTIGIVIIALLVFSAGVTVGFHKATFGNNWGQHYNENFGIGHGGPGMMGIGGLGMTDYFPNAHGTTGKIIKIELPTIIVQDKDNTEKVVLIGSDTNIEQARTPVKDTDLKINDFVVVIGTPNTQGQIAATFIRLIPSPESLSK